MATRTVRKIKRNKVKDQASGKTSLTEELPPAIVVTPPDARINNTGSSTDDEMKVKAPKFRKDRKVALSSTSVNEVDNNRDINEDSSQIETAASQSQPDLTSNICDQTFANISVNKLIAELSENSKASKQEIAIIQRRLLNQANEILKVNAYANSQLSPETRVLENHQKYSTGTPLYGKLPIVAPRHVSTPSSNTVTPNQHQRPIINNTSTEISQNNLDNSHQNIAKQGISLSTTQVNASNHLNLSLDNQPYDTQLVPEKLQRTADIPRPFPVGNAGVMINSGQENMQRVAMTALDAGRGVFFSGTGSASARAPASVRAALHGVYDNGPSAQLSLPPAYRMPPAPEAALPGAPAPTPAPLHTHSAKFPIEREVILSSGDKNSKVPILQEARRRGRLGAVAPDTPPKALAAWTHGENHQQAGTSAETNFRQYNDQNYTYAMQNQGAIPRNHQGYETSPKPPVPAKNVSIYSQKIDTPNNSQSITVTVETGKDSTRDAPKSTKSVSKTYHTLKDMISSRFKSKENGESEKPSESDQGLNNSDDRQSRTEPDPPIARDNGSRKMEPVIYGRPMPQNRPDMQYNHGLPNNMAYPSPSAHRQMQQQTVHQQMLLNQQARSQEMLASSTPQASRPTALVADSLYQQYGPPGRRSAMYQRDIDIRSLANFTSLKQTTPQSQFENPNSRADMRSPQQLEREIIRQRGLVEGRRAASHPHLLDEPQYKPEIASPQIHERSRRNSYGNLLDEVQQENGRHLRGYEERESDDGGFRARLVAQGRSSFEDKQRTNGHIPEQHRTPEQRRPEHFYRKTPDPTSHKPEVLPKPESSRRTPDSINHKIVKDEHTTGQIVERNDENTSQKSSDSVYHSGKAENTYHPQPCSSRQTPNRIEDLKSHGKKGVSGSGASSDYDKNGGQSSNVDSGRGSVAYSSGRRPEVSLHDTSADSDALGLAARTQPQPGPSQQAAAQEENEWADLVECELRQILEPKLSCLRLDSSGSSVTSVTPPLPPLSPSSDVHKRNSLPARASEYVEDRRVRGRESPRWHGHKKHSSKRDHHYKKHLFGLDTTDMTSTTTRSLDLSSLLDGRTDSDASTGDARAIRRQLRGLENMYAEVLQLLGVRKPASLAKQQPWESSRLSSKRRYGSMSSLPSSSVSSRPVRDKRRPTDHRKKHDLKGINKRFQRLESHVVTLARSVAHLSSEMRTQHLVMQEMDSIRAEIAALRHMYKSQAYLRHGHHQHNDPYSFSNPDRVKRLTKFFGDEPPLMRIFLKKLGYEKYAALLEKEKVGAAELPYVGEDKLRALGVPLGPRMRILKEAGIHQEMHHLSRDDPHNTTTTLAIV